MPVAPVVSPSATSFRLGSSTAPSPAVASGGIHLLSSGTDFANLRDAVGAVAAGRQAIDSLAAKLGFTSPPPDAMVAQSLVGWVDFASRNVFIAPSSGWKAPSSLWQPVLKVDSDWIKGMLGKVDPAQPDPSTAVDPKPVVAPPERPEPPEPPEEGERPELPWSLARKLTDDEWVELREAASLLREGREAIAERAAELGFKPPSEDVVGMHVLVGWVNDATGEMFVAPGGGWTPPNDGWQTIAKLVPPNPMIAPPEPPKPPEPPEPPEEGERPELPWSLARKLTDDEWAELREAASLLREGREAIAERAAELGFKPPSEDAAGTHALVGWVNDATGEMFVAPGGGWTPPDESWKPIAKLVPPNPIIAPPERPEPPEPPEEGERPELPWSLARKLTDDEWVELREAASLLREGREAIAERAAELGFKPPSEDAAGTHALVGWVNDATGEMFVAPGGGWTPPDDSWKPIAKVVPPAPPGWGGSGKPPVDSDVDSDPEVGDDDAGTEVIDGSVDGAEPVDPVPPPVARPDPKPMLGQMVDAIHMIGNALTAGSPIEGRVELKGGSEGNPRLAYEWRVGDKVIEGATSLKLPMMPLLAGRDISVKVSLEDSVGARDSIIRTIDAPQVLQSAAGKLMHWAQMAERKSAGESDNDVNGTTDASQPQAGLLELPARDRWDIEGVIEAGRFAVRASAPPEAQASTAISASDALAALKLAHGRNPNVDPDGPGPRGADAARPFQLIAADIDGNGVIDRSDVQDLMRDMFDSATAAAAKQRWLFVPERAHLEGVSRNAVHWDEPASDPSAAAADNWIGVMLGDIDGSWRPDLSAPAY